MPEGGGASQVHEQLHEGQMMLQAPCCQPWRLLQWSAVWRPGGLWCMAAVSTLWPP
jgi:hypothetical protein